MFEPRFPVTERRHLVRSALRCARRARVELRRGKQPDESWALQCTIGALRLLDHYRLARMLEALQLGCAALDVSVSGYPQ